MPDGAADPLPFLSPAWLTALDTASRVVPAPGARLTVRHEVTGCPPDGRTVAFSVHVDPHGVRVVASALDPDPGRPAGAGPGDAGRGGVGPAPSAGAGDPPRTRPNGTGPPVVVFHCAYGDAAALHQGRANAQQLVLDGRLRCSGDLGGLHAHAEVFAALARAWAGVRERTLT